MSSTITIAYPMTAQRVGEFMISRAYQRMWNGQRLSTAPLNLIVTKAVAPSAATPM